MLWTEALLLGAHRLLLPNPLRRLAWVPGAAGSFSKRALPLPVKLKTSSFLIFILRPVKASILLLKYLDSLTVGRLQCLQSREASGGSGHGSCHLQTLLACYSFDQVWTQIWILLPSVCSLWWLACLSSGLLCVSALPFWCLVPVPNKGLCLVFIENRYFHRI